MQQARQLRFLIHTIVAALVGGGIALGSYPMLLPSTQKKLTFVGDEPSISSQPIQLAALPTTTNPTAAPNLVQAAQTATPAVVHIKATYASKIMQSPKGGHPLDQLFREFFGEGFDAGPREYKSQPQHATGSGVIITANGYIVTNDHVVHGADHIEVTLDDNRRYKARLIGKDPNTDLALLKIEGKQLPYLQFGDSDSLQVGEWVLAVGNPFNLTSTVTKGIVSAKARKIDIPQNKDQILRIEAFIQTDAAVNRGNSGGALVNLQGELVGINTAIATNNGNFTGYSFAIPSSIVKKITEDLKKYGMVQRAMLGISIRDVDADLAEKEGLKNVSGVYVADIAKGGAAIAAGIQVGDVIVAINDKTIKNVSQLQEQIARYKPEDSIQVTCYRENREKRFTVQLKGLEDTTQIVRTKDTIEVGGATFENADRTTLQRLKLSGGIHIKTLKDGPWRQSGLKQGTVIVAIDKEPIANLEQLVHILTHKQGGILVESCAPQGTRMYHGVDLGK